MNFPEDIAELEAMRARALGVVEQDEKAVARSDEPLAEKVFLASSEKWRKTLEKKLYLAKTERKFEVIRLRLNATHFGARALPLRLLVKFIASFNAMLEKSAWRFWDSAGVAARIKPEFIEHLGLQLAGVEVGSTELVILGNTAPDLSGISALESALRDVFDLLDSDAENFADNIDAIGIEAGKSLSEFLVSLEKEPAAVELEWGAPEGIHQWQANLDEVGRIRELLDDLGEPTISHEQFTGTVNLLSIRNRIEVERTGTNEKLRIGYNKSSARLVHELRLGDKRAFEVEKTVYTFVVSKRKRDTYRLVNITDLEQ